MQEKNCGLPFQDSVMAALHMSVRKVETPPIYIVFLPFVGQSSQNKYVCTKLWPTFINMGHQRMSVVSDDRPRVVLRD